MTFFSPVKQSVVANRMTDIPLKSLNYTLAGTETFAAQVFNYPSTQANFAAYFNNFDKYHLSRSTIFEYALSSSTDQNSFMDIMERNKKTIELFYDKNESVIFVIAKMPRWLSDSDDQTPLLFDKSWKTFNTHQPKDYDAWQMLIKRAVEFLKSIKPKEVTIFYEIWNEPNLPYWQDSTDDFLKLYQKTAEAIIEVDGQSKVGGPAVSNYYGAIGSQDRQPLIKKVLDHCNKTKCRIDFISFHAFTYAFYETLRDATKYIKETLHGLSFDTKPIVIVSEWNSPEDIRGSYSHCAAMINGFYSFWKHGIAYHTWASWEDFTPNNPNDYGLLSREKGDSQKAIERPVYWGFCSMDMLVKDSEGINVTECLDGLKLIVSKSTRHNEFKCVIWNFVNHPDIRATYYIMEAIPIEELIRDYKDSKTIKHHIHIGKSINGKRDDEFREANRLYQEDLKNQDAYQDYVINVGSKIMDVTNTISIRTAMTQKNLEFEGSNIIFNMQNNEVVAFTIRLND